MPFGFRVMFSLFPLFVFHSLCFLLFCLFRSDFLFHFGSNFICVLSFSPSLSSAPFPPVSPFLSALRVHPLLSLLCCFVCLLTSCRPPPLPQQLHCCFPSQFNKETLFFAACPSASITSYIWVLPLNGCKTTPYV